MPGTSRDAKFLQSAASRESPLEERMNLHLRRNALAQVEKTSISDFDYHALRSREVA